MLLRCVPVQLCFFDLTCSFHPKPSCFPFLTEELFRAYSEYSSWYLAELFSEIIKQTQKSHLSHLCLYYIYKRTFTQVLCIIHILSTGVCTSAKLWFLSTLLCSSCPLSFFGSAWEDKALSRRWVCDDDSLQNPNTAFGGPGPNQCRDHSI